MKTYTGPAGGEFALAANWSDNSLDFTGDCLISGTQVAHDCTKQVGQIGSLTLQDAGLTLNCSAPTTTSGTLPDLIFHVGPLQFLGQSAFTLNDSACVSSASSWGQDNTLIVMNPNSSWFTGGGMLQLAGLAQLMLAGTLEATIVADMLTAITMSLAYVQGDVLTTGNLWAALPLTPAAQVYSKIFGSLSVGGRAFFSLAPGVNAGIIVEADATLTLGPTPFEEAPGPGTPTSNIIAAGGALATAQPQCTIFGNTYYPVVLNDTTTQNWSCLAWLTSPTPLPAAPTQRYALPPGKLAAPALT